MAGKIFRWIWFAGGTFGLLITTVHSWHRLGFWDALLVTSIACVYDLEWFGRTLAYQWDIPKEEFY